MLLHIEGLVERDDAGRWYSLMPVMDSVQTARAREFSLSLAGKIYPHIAGECRNIVENLRERGQYDNAFAVIFSYVLDGRIWDSFNSFEDLRSSATWEGECWALYNPRDLACGTNSYNGLSVCWTEEEPEFVWDELDPDSFIIPFLEDYEEHDIITDPEIVSKAMAMGLAGGDGSLLIPVIDADDMECAIKLLSVSTVRVRSIGSGKRSEFPTAKTNWPVRCFTTRLCGI